MAIDGSMPKARGACCYPRDKRARTNVLRSALRRQIRAACDGPVRGMRRKASGNGKESGWRREAGVAFSSVRGEEAGGIGLEAGDAFERHGGEHLVGHGLARHLAGRGCRACQGRCHGRGGEARSPLAIAGARCAGDGQPSSKNSSYKHENPPFAAQSVVPRIPAPLRIFYGDLVLRTTAIGCLGRDKNTPVKMRNAVDFKGF